MFYDWLNFILRDQVMNTFSKISQYFGCLFLSWIHIFLKGSVERQHYQFVTPYDS